MSSTFTAAQTATQEGAVASAPAPRPSTRRGADDLGVVVAMVERELADLDAALARQLSSPVGSIPHVGGHLLDAGGKRLRPLLALLAARATDAPIGLATAVGVAAELIHTATLFHDDVVDDGRVRRGRPAARMVYGNGIVVLVGDFCLARALEAVTDTGVLPLIQSLAATVKEMAEGEVAQLEGAGDPDVTVDHYHAVIDRKTASLIAWSARVGGALPPAQDAALARYGRALGRAFQIADDILDCSLDEAATGKTVGNDLREGKLTLPVLLACDRTPGLRARLRAALTEQGVDPAAVPELLQAVADAGGVAAARDHARALAEEATRAVQLLPPGGYRGGLVTLARLSVERVR